MRTTIALRSPDGPPALWKPTTLDQIGKHEADLEAALSETPELLCLETKRTGIYAPFAVFNQLALPTPMGREIYPDITLLTASGDVVIVEVKLFANPEIRNRSVIAQIIDYVSSISALDEDGMARLFNGGVEAEWTALVRSHFPHEEDVDELAAEMLANAAAGDVRIVIACDKAPKGAYDLARSVSAQSHLGFSLDVLEVTPYVPADGPIHSIMYVPNVRLSTEIVARTAVSVSVQPGTQRPVVNVETTSVEDIEENLASAAEGRPRQTRGRSWTNKEIEDVFMASDDPTVRDLFLFAKAEGFKGRFQSDGPKVSPAFGFYLRVRRPNGTEGGSQVFNCTDDGGNAILVYLNNWPAAAVSAEDLDGFKADLRALLGSSINVDVKDVKIELPLLADKLDGFKEVIRKMQRRIDARARLEHEGAVT
jgi:hypothetical protein